MKITMLSIHSTNENIHDSCSSIAYTLNPNQANHHILVADLCDDFCDAHVRCAHLIITVVTRALAIRRLFVCVVVVVVVVASSCASVDLHAILKINKNSRDWSDPRINHSIVFVVVFRYISSFAPFASSSLYVWHRHSISLQYC